MICLGNLSVSDIEKRLSIKFSEEDKKWLEERHNPNANYIKENGWHCYDIPFSFCCGSNEFAQECVKVLSNKLSCSLFNSNSTFIPLPPLS